MIFRKIFEKRKAAKNKKIIEEIQSEIDSKSAIGAVEAKARLAAIYEEGAIVSQDFEKSAALYQSIVDIPESTEAKSNWRIILPSINRLAFYYRNGLGVEQNQEKALRLSKRAAEAHCDIEAVANVYENNGRDHNSSSSIEEAIKTCVVAAENGYVLAQMALAIEYRHNRNSSQKSEEECEAAHQKWLRLAAKNGHPGAIGQLDYLEKSISKKKRKNEIIKLAREGDAVGLYELSIFRA